MAKSVAIRHPRDPGRPWVIPAERYDPSVHELWVEPLPGQPKPVAFGEVFNVPPEVVQHTEHTYQTHDGPLDALDLDDEEPSE